MPKQSKFAGQTLAAARRELQSALAALKLEAAPLEARRLLEFATRSTTEEILRDEVRILSPDEAHLLDESLARRLAHEPLSRITGERGFYGRMFAVTPDVLDPRPETETLIDVVLRWADDHGGRDRRFKIIDVGTGSGCILLTLLAELPNAEGVASDLCASALAVAQSNAARLGVGQRVDFQVADALDGIAGPFDILVSNPPYIPTSEIAALEPEVRDFDPHRALDGGRDGLQVYRLLAARAGAVVPSGLIAVEVGAGQAKGVGEILAAAVENSCGSPIICADLGGIERTVALLTQR